jgi:hypothetical protein
MKLEIDIDGDYYKIICKRVEENKPYHSPYEYEVIADGKPIEQEPFKPMVEIDLYSVIKQKYIEREALDKIRAEIEELRYGQPFRKFVVDECLEILDKYKADREALADIYKPTLKADLCIMDEFAFEPQAESEAVDGTNK